jgi:hypothetical protein
LLKRWHFVKNRYTPNICLTKTKKMEKIYKILKFLVRLFTTKNWRGHKRSQRFQRLFNYNPNADEMSRENGKILGIINYESTSFGSSCHDMAERYAFYPFDSTTSINMTKFFTKYCQQDFTSLKATITRTCPILKLLSGYGTYKITLIYEKNGYTYEKRYEKTIKLR